MTSPDMPLRPRPSVWIRLLDPLNLQRRIGDALQTDWADNAAPLGFLILSVAVFGVLLPDFFSPGSLVETLRQMGEVGLVVLAVMIVMLVGGIDLSVGSLFALANFVAMGCANLLHLPVLVIFPVAIGVSALVGLTTGVLIGYLRLRAFLTTLALLILIRSVVEVLLQRYAVAISSSFVDSDLWYLIGEGAVLGLPVSLIVLGVVGVLLHVTLTRSRFGWYVSAVGSSRRAAHTMGLPVARTVALTYMLSGALCGLAGALYATRLSSVGADTGVGLEIVAIAAAILGGNSLGGGRGSVAKALVGTAIVLVVMNGVVRLGLKSGAGQLVLGLVLILAISVDVAWLRSRDRLAAHFRLAPRRVLNEAARPLVAPPRRAVRAEELADRRDLAAMTLVSGEPVFGTAQGHVLPQGNAGGPVTALLGLRDGGLLAGVAGAGLIQILSGRPDVLAHRAPRSWLALRDNGAIRAISALTEGEDGAIYATDASLRHDAVSWRTDLMEGQPTGRLLQINHTTGRVRVLARNLACPMGLCVSNGALWVTEAGTGRLSRMALSGPDRGGCRAALTGLPGYPGPVVADPEGGMWLGFLALRDDGFDALMADPHRRVGMMRRLPPDAWPAPDPARGILLHLDAIGRIDGVMTHLPDGQPMPGCRGLAVQADGRICLLPANGSPPMLLQAGGQP